MSVVYLQKTTEPRKIRGLLEQINPDINTSHAFIKPNIVAPAKPSSGVVTDPELVRGVIEYLRDRGVRKITIGETPGLGVDVQKAFRVSRFLKLARETGVDIVDLSTQEVVRLPWAWGKIQIPKIALESYYINMPKLKTHMNTTVTLGLKNQKGLLRDGFKKLVHIEGLHRPVMELARVVRPNLTIIDGLVGLEGDGPLFSGKKVDSNVYIVGDDVVAVDAVGCRVMGIDPLDVEHIRLAAEAGIGTIDPEVKGERIQDVVCSFKRANEECRRILRFTNWRNPCACSMCGDELTRAVKQIATTPWLALTCGPKFAYRFVLGGIDVLSGRDSKVPEKHGRIICLGKCTKDLAEKNGFVWVRGCPPEAKDIVDGFRRL